MGTLIKRKTIEKFYHTCSLNFLGYPTAGLIGCGIAMQQMHDDDSNARQLCFRQKNYLRVDSALIAQWISTLHPVDLNLRVSMRQHMDYLNEATYHERLRVLSL